MKNLIKMIEECALKDFIPMQPIKTFHIRQEAFIAGANSRMAREYWQQGMYDPRDLQDAFNAGVNYGMDETNSIHPNFKNWFEQIKSK